MSELDEIRKRKLEDLKRRYIKGDQPMTTAPNAPIHITDNEFDETIKKYPNLVIDCWAPWCGPCKMLGPIIDELAKELQGKMTFAKLNVDENPQTSMKHQIMSIPTLLVFKNGQLVNRLVGALPKEMLKQQLGV
jgi:thioredoxin 1